MTLRPGLDWTNLRWISDGFLVRFLKISLDLAFCVYTVGWENHSSADYNGILMTLLDLLHRILQQVFSLLSLHWLKTGNCAKTSIHLARKELKNHCFSAWRMEKYLLHSHV